MRLATHTISLPLFAVSALAQSCYSTVNSILSTGNAISPTTVLLQLEYTQQSINSGGVNVADAINNACASVSDPGQVAFCAAARSSQGASIVTQASVGTLNALIDCFTAYINQQPDYTLTAGSYFNFAGGGAPVVVPSPRAQSPSVKKRTSVFRTLAAADTVLDLSSCPAKPDVAFTGLDIKRQQRRCSTTVTCYTTCRSCQAQAALCEGAGAVGVAAACGTIGNVATTVLGTIAVNAACLGVGALCGPGGGICLPACIAILPQVVGGVVTLGCGLGALAACNFATTQCSACNAANNNICNPNTAQCCPTETGRRCGVDCCCCGGGFAPRGPNCECVPSA